ncbi:hypothetical protein ANO11243_070020 [Dothideomycetidae sp. 11243]|nr:hypothetical protein ANO11243_070020 [fungal sp. No.11243]
MAYVPPALRNQATTSLTVSNASSDDVPPTHRNSPNLPLSDIVAHFWATPISQLNPDDGTSLVGNPQKHKPSTLNASAERPDELMFVISITDANPAFTSDGTIHAKSNLALLASYDNSALRSDSLVANNDKANDSTCPDTTTEPQIERTTNVSRPPIPIFVQIHISSLRKKMFRFAGYSTLTGVTYHPANTASLAEMLDRKWTRMNRRGEKIHRTRSIDEWARSFALDWAEVCFVRDKEYERVYGAPDIRSNVSQPMVSVDEMLRA